MNIISHAHSLGYRVLAYSVPHVKKAELKPQSVRAYSPPCVLKAPRTGGFYCVA